MPQDTPPVPLPAEALRIFVAMPGSDMGPDAPWDSADQIVRRFYTPIAASISERLNRDVDLVIEKEKYLPGSIYTSMYSEAWNADVYLADLTGANANVYLELGVRWALSDGVTILLAQDPSKLLFNVAAARAQPYSNDPDLLEKAIDRVASAVVDGLKIKDRGGTDSAVREGGDVRTITTKEYEELQSELRRLRSERGEEYLEAARKAPTLSGRIDLIRKAVAVNPLVAESHFQLGTALRQTGSDDKEAIEHLETATLLDPESGPYWRELGVAYSKTNDPRSAIVALERAVNINPNDYDALSVLGGAHRRIALRAAPHDVDWDQLERARSRYEQASRVSQRDSYPLLNVARIEMMLSKVEPALADSARARFQDARPLCEYERSQAFKAANRPESDMSQKVEAAYKAFDYADTLLYSRRFEEASDAYKAAVAATPTDVRQDVFRSVKAGFAGLLELNVLDAETVTAVAAIDTALLS